MFLQPQSRSLVLRGAVVVASTYIAGCSLVPGTYLGVTSSDIKETDRDYVYDTPGAASLSERAEIFSITPASIARLAAEQQKRFARPTGLSIAPSVADEYQYIVGPQDTLRITIWNHPELSNPVGTLNELSGRVVNSDGTFFFPYAGNVRAAGRTVQEIREELASKLARYLVEPQVDVSVLSYRSKKAFVVGQVEKPGVVPITDVPLTVTDLISQAGGLKAEADLRGATLMRKGVAVPIDLYSLYYAGNISQNVRLEPGDILTIPENRYNKVFVLGEVTKPQSIVMPRGRLSLAEAISDSGGFNPLTANAGQLYVIRAGQNDKTQIWHLDASSPDALVLADRFDLEARDIVYVDPAGVARFGRVINNILPTASVIRATIQY